MPPAECFVWEPREDVGTVNYCTLDMVVLEPCDNVGTVS